MTSIGWLSTDSEEPWRDREAEAEQRVLGASARLNEPRLYGVVCAFNQVLGDWGLVDEWLRPAERFVELFRGERIGLNEGVDSLDFVRECVRRSFSISEVIAFGPKDQRSSWVDSEKLETISQLLVSQGWFLENDPSFALELDESDEIQLP